MKRLLITLGILFGAVSMNAQELGLRFGSHSFGNVAIDGVFSAGQFSRIHADVTFGDGFVGIDALWDFIYRPLGDEAWNWYVGAGPFTYFGNSFFGLGATGEIGIEYKFNSVPIALGIDYRPYLLLVEETDFSADTFGFNVRYVFQKK